MTNREIDFAIAEKMMGWERISMEPQNNGWFWANGNEHVAWDSFSPSTNISDAWQVVEKIQQEYFITVTCGRESGFRDGKIRFSCKIGLYENAGEAEWYTEESTAPMAICLATLQAKGVEIE